MGPSRAIKAASIACILLVALGVSFQVAHLHLDAKLAPGKHCSICLGAHVALPSVGVHPLVSKAATPAAPVVAKLAGHVPFHSFSLYNRPPPPQA